MLEMILVQLGAIYILLSFTLAVGCEITLTDKVKENAGRYKMLVYILFRIAIFLIGIPAIAILYIKQITIKND